MWANGVLQIKGINTIIMYFNQVVTVILRAAHVKVEIDLILLLPGYQTKSELNMHNFNYYSLFTPPESGRRNRKYQRKVKTIKEKNDKY